MKCSMLPCLVVWAVCAGAVSAQMPLYSEYYPLKVGNRWVYQFIKPKSVESKNPPRVTIEVEREEIYARMVKVGKNDVIEKWTGYRLKTTSGAKVSHDHDIVLDGGIHRFEIAGKPLTPPLRFFKLPLDPGETWQANSRSGETVLNGTFTWKNENVRVPAGEFPAIFIAYREANSPIEVDRWFVRGIGMVKQRVKNNTMESLLELESHTLAK